MPNYRRNFQPGATYFFTVVLRDRDSNLLAHYIHALRAAYREVRNRLPFRTDAIVVLPDHLHAVWTLPAGETDYPARWRLIKAGFSRRIPRIIGAVGPVGHGRGERGIWQRRYWEHTIRDGADFANHIDYIHFNPVRHGHVSRVADWRWSSFHRYVREGTYPLDWGGVSGEEPAVTGEPRT